MVRNSRFEVDAAGGTLTINDVRMEDKGNYVCVVNTTAQPIVTSTNAHLYVESEFYSSLDILPTSTAVEVYVGRSVAPVVVNLSGRTLQTHRLKIIDQT